MKWPNYLHFPHLNGPCKLHADPFYLDCREEIAWQCFARFGHVLLSPCSSKGWQVRGSEIHALASCPWGGYTDRIVCNIYEEECLPSSYRAMLDFFIDSKMLLVIIFARSPLPLN